MTFRSHMDSGVFLLRFDNGTSAAAWSLHCPQQYGTSIVHRGASAPRVPNGSASKVK
ncbi:hypothetical protein M404DRAFT_488896 [Pisolithus tinctorius Marx 270]|uniref:Uncharacterized protein n=1 Tax=Pisolithus tinctorius Marx 270 TaxID=870435 RepID=A0A0C3PDU7_PISTI|nr:hypothetical protein M404DRAFT_488896 [Pisolithus tinctorius Marx 270]